MCRDKPWPFHLPLTACKRVAMSSDVLCYHSGRFQQHAWIASDPVPPVVPNKLIDIELQVFVVAPCDKALNQASVFPCMTSISPKKYAEYFFIKSLQSPHCIYYMSPDRHGCKLQTWLEEAYSHEAVILVRLSILLNHTLLFMCSHLFQLKSI